MTFSQQWGLRATGTAVEALRHATQGLSRHRTRSSSIWWSRLTSAMMAFGLTTQDGAVGNVIDQLHANDPARRAGTTDRRRSLVC